MTRIIAICLQMCLVVLLVGCWNREELNEVAIVTGIGVDKSKPEEGFVLTYQVVEPKRAATTKEGSSGKDPVVLYRGTGKTLFEATRRTAPKLPRRLFFSHSRLFVVSEKVAKEGIGELLDFIERNDEFRPTMQLFIARNTEAYKLMQGSTPLDKISSNSIVDETRISEKIWGNNLKVTLGEYLRDPKSPAVIPGLQLVDSDVQVSGMAVFNEQKLADWIEEPEARGLLWIKNKIQSSVISLSCKPKQNGVGLVISGADTKVKAKVVNKQPTILIQVTAEASIGEDDCSIDLTKPGEFTKLEKKLSDQIKSEIDGVIQQEQRKNLDVFGFGGYVMRTDKRYWHEIKNEWKDMFSQVEVHVEVASAIRRTGMRSKSFSSS
ncbi:Ger(x)C family spore germination protein [Paenibacillus sp. P36]|uniref:Ger(x)C family spore germination protein n=1 Tax=Paenibacillus sp. P36 TaxID=3342538 RepID=UPI0038B3D76F